MGNIIDFDGVTKLDIDPDKILEGAKGNLDCVVTIGWDKDDCLYIASSTSKIADILFLLEKAKFDLLDR